MAVVLLVLVLGLMAGHTRHLVALVVGLVRVAYHVTVGLAHVAKVGVRHEHSHVA